jgi:hypothetical protein
MNIVVIVVVIGFMGASNPHAGDHQDSHRRSDESELLYHG